MSKITGNLNDPFKAKGSWWLPGSKNHLRGELTYDPQSGISLDLDGSFFPFNVTLSGSYTQPEIIHGQLNNGTDVTLKNNFITNVSGGLGAGAMSLRLDSNQAFIGDHLTTTKDFLFSELHFHLVDFECWFSQRALNTDMDEYRRSGKATVTFNRPQELTIKSEALKTRISTYTNLNFSGLAAHVASASMTYTRVFRLQPNGKRSIDWLMERQFILRSFFSILVGDPLHLSKVHFKKSASSDPIFMLFKSKASPSANKKRHPAEICFPYPAIVEQLPKLLDNWSTMFFKSKPSFWAMWNFETRSGPFDYFSFLTIAQALESYYGYGVHSKDGYLKEALKKTLARQKRANRHLITKQVRKFNDRIVLSRNYYTHFNPKKKKKSLQGARLFYVSMKLDLLLRIDILRRIGLSEDIVITGLKRNPSLRHWIQFVVPL